MKYIILLFCVCNLLRGQSFNDYKNFLIRFEGYKKNPYYNNGNLMVGIGHKAVVNKFYTNKEINDFFKKDLSIALNTCRKIYPDFNKYPYNIKLVLVSMSFQLGENKLRKFIRFNAAIRAGDLKTAKKELTSSRLARECPNRIEELKKLLN